MKNKLVKVITISCLVIVVSLFLMVLFSDSISDNTMAYTIDNNNLNKMDENTSILFEKKKLLDEVKEETVIDEQEETIEKEPIIEEIVQVEKPKLEVKEEVEQPVVEEPQEEEKVEANEPVRTSLSEEREVLQTVVGTLTGYGPDCVGCGGHTSTGFDLTKTYYYEDSEFGTVRILAADPSFPFYSIFRVSNVPTMDDFIGIVLDRGGNVGFGRGTLFDLAFESESSPDLVPLTRNVTFEMLRSGK